MTNAQALSWLRRRMGLTQTELARLSGVAQSQISRLEAGGDGLLSTWVKLYAALGVGLRLLPTSHDAGPALEAARRRFRERNFRQKPRVRRPCKKAESGPT
jgi:transcriptional regulator with XRE-family HTH domain